MKAQTDAMAAQARSAIIQHLPPLSWFTGEGQDAVDDNFGKWAELFKERAMFSGWGPDDQLYHLKTHLEKSAYGNLPDSSKTDVSSATRWNGRVTSSTSSTEEYKAMRPLNSWV